MPIGEWTTVAAADDTLVAGLLLGLKHSAETRIMTIKTVTKSDSLLSGGFGWGRQKARSRSVMDTEEEFTKRATRSPTTPLRWSGGASSGYADGYEASSMMCCGSPPSRSKTYGKLKEEEEEEEEEEGLLLQESQILKRDLATMHLTSTHHRITNKNFKRIKRVNVHSKGMHTSNVVETSILQGMPSLFKMHNTRYDIPPRLEASISFDIVPAVKGGGESFVLPDLNMLPSIEEEPF